MTREELLEKLDKETKALEAFVQQCNQEIVFRKGRIDLLQDLLKNTEGDAHDQPHD